MREIIDALETKYHELRAIERQQAGYEEPMEWINFSQPSSSE